MMIGNFLFSNAAHPDDVVVRLGVSDRGESIAHLIVPEAIKIAMVRSQYPVLDGIMSAESALSYGLFLAIRAGRSLIISGERSAWDPAWGQLIDARSLRPAVALT